MSLGCVWDGRAGGGVPVSAVSHSTDSLGLQKGKN